MLKRLRNYLERLGDNMENDMIEIELNGLLDTSNDNIVITDGDGIILRASPSCLSIYGWDASILIGRSVDALEQENIFSPSVTKLVLQARKKMQIIQETPTNRLVMATAQPVWNESGDIVRVISYSHDLTEIQELKEDFEALKMKMERYQSEIEELREKDHTLDGVVIKSKAINRIWQLVQRVAKSDASVVFLGESGVGKNVFAHALHQESDRKEGPFIEVNCSAIPETLFESEMFGFKAGSFTGANKQGKIGLIELADKGTLFLDEVGELPLSVQAKLLKAIQEKKITSIGGVKAKNIDFRLVVSTNQDLEEMVRKGEFRQDLFYRLNVIPITIPSLRERKEDILMLAHFYLNKFNKKYKTDKFYDTATIEELTAYDWPGNVRELENMVERLILTTEGRTIYPEYLPFYIQKGQHYDISENPIEMFEESGKTLPEAVKALEISLLKRAFRQFKTTYQMAEHLGVSQSGVVRKLQRYNINSKTI